MFPSGLDFLVAASTSIDDEFSYIPEFSVWKSNIAMQPEIYGRQYFDNYIDLRGSEIANKLNDARCEMLEKQECRSVLDIGIGSGEFLEACEQRGWAGYGYDINPTAVELLKKENKFIDPYRSETNTDAVTMWDVLEHIPEPHKLLACLHSKVFVSIPVFFQFAEIRASKHYKPGEHLWYWTPHGLVRYMASFGFELLETNDAETAAGRSGIRSFAFRRA